VLEGRESESNRFPSRGRPCYSDLSPGPAHTWCRVRARLVVAHLVVAHLVGPISFIVHEDGGGGK